MQSVPFFAPMLAAIALFIGTTCAKPVIALGARPSPSLTSDQRATALASRIADRSCGLRLDGTGPDARCSRYRDACLRYGNPDGRCNERLDACTRCAVAYQDCEKRATGIARILTSCERCIADFKRCTREYDKRLPAKRP